MSDRKPQDQDKFIVRLPDGMRDALKRLAETNRRSMNAEIVAALDMHIVASGGPNREYSEDERKISDLMMIVAGLQSAKKLLMEAQGVDPALAAKMWPED